MVKTLKIILSTKGWGDMINITPQIESFIQKSKIDEGVVSVFVKGSTGAVTTIEYEPNLVKDFEESLDMVAPADKIYNHKKTWNDDNGFSHIRASLVGPSETIPFSEGKMFLGTWQQVVIIDFDTGSRTREVFLSIIK